MEKGKRTKPNQSHIQRPSVRREKKLLLWMMVTAWSVALLGLGLTSVPTQVAAGSGSVLTVVVRDSYGSPLSGVKCEVLSYDWGLKRDQPYTVIAQGESNQNGSVAFDDSSWPNSGYRFRFSPTDHVRPATTYFLPEDQNQYRGYPAAVVGGWGLPQSPAQVQANGQSEYFVVAADGLVYNDLSGGKGSPTFQKDPVGGLDRPRVSPQAMSSQNYLATARAVTATAFAQGVPTKTIPPPPPTFSGVVAAALPITPIPAGPGDPGTKATPAPRASVTAGSSSGGNGNGNSASGGNGSLTLPQPTQTPILIEKNTGTVAGTSQTQAQAHKSDALGSVLLALFGIGCLFMFFVYRWRIYALLGVDQALIDLPRRGQGRTKKLRKTKPTAHTPARTQPSRTQPSKTRQNQNQNRPGVTKPEPLTSQNHNNDQEEN